MEKELQILSESLDQKMKILQGLLQLSEKQGTILQETDPDLEAFDKIVEQKDKLIDVLTHLDDGFESMYEKLSDGLKGKQSAYKDRIAELQKKITKVTGLSVKIQEQESQNKQKMDDFFQSKRQEIKNGRRNSKAAYDYYKRVSNMGNAVDTSTMDSKQ